MNDINNLASLASIASTKRKKGDMSTKALGEEGGSVKGQSLSVFITTIFSVFTCQEGRLLSSMLTSELVSCLMLFHIVHLKLQNLFD